MLARLLASIKSQCLTDIELRLVVVDNDPSCSARDVVMTFLRDAQNLHVIYRGQPVKSISLTRNMALDLVDDDTRFIGFLDDDEYIHCDWLREMMSAISRFRADVVFGPVVTVYPETCPAWIRKGGYFDRVRRKNGAVMRHGGAGNVFMIAAIATKERYRFDIAYGSTGGEDTEFFSRLSRAGKQMVWCDSAIALEDLSGERAKAAWILKRAFSNGQNYARVYDSRLPVVRRKIVRVQKLLYGLAALVSAPIFLVFGFHRSFSMIKYSASSFGRVFNSDRPMIRLYD